MKTFEVIIQETVGGTAFITANSMEEAEALAESILDESGVEGFTDFDPTHRETEIINIKVKKVKE